MSDARRIKRSKLLIGWREWVHLPELLPDPIKAKIDTGARTSALHAYHVHEYLERGVRCVEFVLHPQQKLRKPERRCRAEVIDQRIITSSNGQRERRYLIGTTLRLGPSSWPIELSLTNRDSMSYRMLLGREGLRGHCQIDPGRSFLQDLTPLDTET